MEMVPGTILAQRFQIEETVGAGGMSTVARARDLRGGDLVAIKLLRRNSPTEQDQERFLREAQLLAELRCPGIVSYVAHGQTDDGQSFLAMEWLTGEDLEQRLRRQPLTVAESLTLLGQVAATLAMVHEHGLIHRDIKPSNLFLRDGSIEKVVLIDFGIARRQLRSLEPTLTRAGLVIGTLQEKFFHRR